MVVKNKERTYDLIIRKMKYEDIDKIVDININDWKKAYKGIIDDNILDSLNKEEKIKKWRKSYNKANTIVAEENGIVIGYCKYDDEINNEKYNIDSEIIGLYVDYNKTKMGVGKKMMEYVMNDLKNKNKNRMILWCLEENQNARRFYESMGGKLIDDEKYYERDGKKFKEVAYIYDIKHKE